jgi:hypothetical protein
MGRQENSTLWDDTLVYRFAETAFKHRPNLLFYMDEKLIPSPRGKNVS